VRVSVLLSPGSREPVPAGSTAVIIDVLRATTTLTYAKMNGAGDVLPVGTPEEAFELRLRHPAALLCGEREGRPIDGFDLGNSPSEYSAAIVKGRTLVFASTNGSLALLRARHARRRVLAAFVNASAVVREVAGADRVVLLCSGKLGDFCLEDAACAGWLVRRLEADGARHEGAGARFASSLAPPDAAAVHALVQGAAQGRYLRSLGPEFATDVEVCAALDTVDRAWSLEL
jgi:2-phosphosulfolactate phosphatase